jgi:hypothetical protein
MLVKVMNLDGTEQSPIFDPAHKEEVVGFYQKLFWRSGIRGYQVFFDDGTGFSVGHYSVEGI